MAPAHSFEFLQRWLVFPPPSLPPTPLPRIVNNGPVTWHPACWVRQLSKRGNSALGQKNQDNKWPDFLIYSGNLQKLQKLQFPDFCVQRPWHLQGWRGVIWAVRAAAHSFIAPGLADALHGNWPAPSDFTSSVIGVVRGCLGAQVLFQGRAHLPWVRPCKRLVGAGIPQSPWCFYTLPPPSVVCVPSVLPVFMGAFVSTRKLPFISLSTVLSKYSPLCQV